MTTLSDCHVTALPHSANSQDLRGSSTVRLGLSGLGCRNCANRVRNALIATPGVVDAEVTLSAAQADVWYRPEMIGPVGLTRVVFRSGAGTHHRYRAVPVNALFSAKARHA